jgi:hypothetical protein
VARELEHLLAGGYLPAASRVAAVVRNEGGAERAASEIEAAARRRN